MRLGVAALALACAGDDPGTDVDSDADTEVDSDALADATAEWRVGAGPAVTVSGRVHAFGPTLGASLDGATVRVAEAPELSVVVADDGTFALEVPSGAPLSFQVVQAGFTLNQSAAIELGAAGVDDLGFQVPTEAMVDVLAQAAGVALDPTRCQIATTVSAPGTPPYGGAGVGERDVVVSIDPPLPADGVGPVYFAYLSDALIVPDTRLTASTIDGGVLFGNVPEGAYTLTATKAGMTFTPVAIRCRAGVLVNAAPPHGLQPL
ncbi:MAG: hypothetical protein H6733_11670 [Alphaproteobacteria bacterium]|nr:hypothetical protein [Alphaproteobacteria bacterium]